MKRFFLCLSIVFISLSIMAQDVVDQLPITWKTQVPNGYMEMTLHENGVLTSKTLFRCYNCSGMGMCDACHGTGGQFFYGIGMMRCGMCIGSGRCQACGGKGYSVLNSSSQYGVTVVVDEDGELHIGSGNSSGGNSKSSRKKVEVIEDIPGYGYDNTIYCSKCGKTTRRHIHVLK